MTERIKELAEQAGYMPDGFGIGHWDMPECKRFYELVQEDERTKLCTFLMKLHKQHKHQHNHFHVAAVNLWESKHE